MRRIRLVFVLLAIALLVPIGLLVDRAVESVALERAMRHQAVAERVFDEMERALSRVLDDVERTSLGAEGAIASTLPFVVGRSDADPQGRAAAPEVDLAIEGGEAEPSADEQSGKALQARPRFGRLRAQVPGTTVELEPGGAGTWVEKNNKEQGRDRLAKAPAVSEYDAFRSLNKAVQERANRRKETALEDQAEQAAGSVAAAPAPPAPALAEDKRVAKGDADDLPPLVGRIASPGELLLTRTVLRGGETVREGVVLDVPKLNEWLRQQALGSDGLADHATISFSNTFEPEPAATGSPYLYRHRFAEPFADLSAQLDLRPLPGVGSARYIYVLALLLLGAGTIGLAALYRMVSVAMSFSERRANFVAAVSHELKTPLTAIRMYGEMLRDGLVSSEAKRDEYYRHITVESERLSRLINNVLEFSRLEKGTREVALVKGSVEPVVAEVAELLRPHLEGQGFELAVEVESGLPAVGFERDGLMQVVWNLVDNAVKYARDGSPRRIDLVVHRVEGGVAIAVRDHGPGVPTRHLGRIFEPFYRGENELTRRNKGTGLGLALVANLVVNMGGTVHAANLPAGGFEVEVRLRA